MTGHALGSWTDTPLARLFSAGGGLGVEIFFVLSGFLITWLLMQEVDDHGKIDLGRFYRRRVARLLPAFYAYMLFGLAILLARHKPVPWGAVASSVVYLINYYQAFTGAQTHFLSHCWSLAVEEQFYIIWPAVLGILIRKHRALLVVLAATIAAVWAYRWILVFGFQATEFYLYRALETRADHLAVGCFLAVSLRSARWRAALEAFLGRRWIWPLLAAAIYVSSLLDDAYEFQFGVGYMVEPVLIGLLLVSTLIAAQRTGFLAWTLNHPAMVHVGRVSYGMYLTHGMVMYSTERAVAVMTGNRFAGFAAAVVATIIVATISFECYERPVRQWLNTRWLGKS